MRIGDILRLTARRQPHEIGVVFAEERITWGDLDRRANRMAQALLGLGLAKGERVAILAGNTPDYLAWYVAVARAGLVGVPLNTWLRAGELTHLLSDSGAAALLLEAPHAAVAAQLATPELRLRIGMGQGHGQPLDLASLIAAASEEEPDVAVTEDDLFVLSYTSGTTGRPKGAMMTHRNAVTGMLSHVEGMSMRPSDVFLLHAPMFFLAAGNNRFNAVHAGCRLVITSFDAARVLELIERERVTHITLGPTALQRLLDHPDAARRDLSSLRMVAGSGAPVPVALAQRAIARLGPVWNVIYGASETCIGTWLRREDWMADGPASPRLASVGRAAPHCEARVVDDSGAEVARDNTTIGEVMLRGASVTLGYWRSPEATEAALRDGWFATGDLATVDADGFISIVDRRKDVIISGGVNIYPREVEDELAAHPAVALCAVIGLPHPEWGEAPHAVVVLREGAAATPEALIAWCATRLASYKKPRGVTFLAALPLTASGKVLKRALRDMVAAGETP